MVIMETREREMIDETKLTDKSSLLIPSFSHHGTTHVFLPLFAGDA